MHQKKGHKHRHHQQYQQRQRLRSDPACGGLGCIDYHNGYDSRAWIPLVNNKQEEEFRHLPYMMRGQRVVKQVPDDPPRPPSLAQMRSRSDPICSSSGCSQYKHPAPPASHPVDYPVPDFGEDPDIRDTLRHEKLSSKVVGHNWEFKTPESYEKYRNKAKDVDYNFAPNLDSDIVHTINSARIAEAGVATSGASLLQNQSEVNLMSDPHCSSAGCTQYKFPEPDPAKDHPKDYFVPNFGQDRDITDTIQHEKNASAQLKHKWIMGTEESKAQWRNRATDALYDFNQKLDGDVTDTQKHIAGAEESTGQKWKYNGDE